MTERQRRDARPDPHFDGRREGIWNDSMGAQYGIHLDKKSLHPEEVKEVREENTENQNNSKK